MATTEVPVRRELDYRRAHNLEVWLLWEPETNATFVKFVQQTGTMASGIPQEFEVDGIFAADAFDHPHAYAPRKS